MQLLNVATVFALVVWSGKGVAYFNNNDLSSDTQGPLEGTVMYVQYQIMPHKVRLQYDEEPHPIMLRHMLVLLKPKRTVTAVTMTVATQGRELMRTDMSPPDTLPAGVRTANVKFTPVSELVIGCTLPGDGLTAQLVADALSSFEVVKIVLWDGSWVPHVTLPSNVSSNRTLLVERHSGYGVSVGDDDTSWSVSFGVTQFKKDTVWVSSMDLPHATYRYGPFWWAAVPYAAVLPNITITFSAGGVTGSVEPPIGGASEGWYNGVELGMLTEGRGGSEFVTNPTLQRYYFYDIPVARATFVEYEPMNLHEVMMPWGDRYTTVDPSTGSVYSGNMRQNTAKALVSQGINAASYGISTTYGGSEELSGTCAQFTAHWAVGLYSNGRVAHGLSGGGGMVTLLGSTGNEVSHELGHNYGLGHYVGGFRYTFHRRAPQWCSTWGWNVKENLFVPNFEPTVSNTSACYDGECEPPWNSPIGPLPWRWDAMGGGSPAWSTERYTLMTPYSMTRVQSFFEDRAVFAEWSPTGFAKWSSTAKNMVPYRHTAVVLDVYTLSEAEARREDAMRYATEVLCTFDVLRQLWENGWPSLVVPAAASCPGKYLVLENTASVNTSATVNGERVVLTSEMMLKYVSRSDKWVAVVSVPVTRDLRPEQFHVPVTTLLGYYDARVPATLSAYVYPGFHGGSGFVYADDGSSAACRCRLVVETLVGSTLTYCLRSAALGTEMNKFHVNVATSVGPTRASVVCNNIQMASRALQGPKRALAVHTQGYTCDDFPSAVELCREVERTVLRVDKEVGLTPIIQHQLQQRTAETDSTGASLSVAPIVAGVVVGAVLLIAVVIIAIVLIRRYRYIKVAAEKSV